MLLIYNKEILNQLCKPIISRERVVWDTLVSWSQTQDLETALAQVPEVFKPSFSILPLIVLMGIYQVKPQHVTHKLKHAM